MTAVSQEPIQKGLAVDANELYAFIGLYTNPLDVVRLQSTTGGIIDTQR